MRPSHVLVPLDGSPAADEALVEALDVYDCRVTVLNVVTPVDASMSESGVLDVDESRRETARDRVARVAARATERAAAVDCSPETAVATGDPAEVILEYVDDHDVDHVVMGGHGGDRTDVGRRLLGTVSTTVVGDAPVPVTVVR